MKALPRGKFSHSRVCRRSRSSRSAEAPSLSLARARACIFPAISSLFEIRDNLISQSSAVYVFRTISISLFHYIRLLRPFPTRAGQVFLFYKCYVKHPLPLIRFSHWWEMHMGLRSCFGCECRKLLKAS